MILHPPFFIGPRLLPTIRLADGVLLSLERVGPGRDFRQYAVMHLDIGDRTYTDDSMQSGQGGFQGMVTIFETYIGFLRAAQESYPDGENADLFPAWVLEALEEHKDEIAVVGCVLCDEETGCEVREELIEE